MSCASLYATGLRARGYRMTPQRLAILHILHHSGKHLSPRQVYEKARKEVPGLTEPTVYRTLEFLAENDLVHVSHSISGHLTYQIAGERHDHLVCRVCGGEKEVPHRLVEDLFRRLEGRSGFAQISSHVNFFGVCPACQSN